MKRKLIQWLKTDTRFYFSQTSERRFFFILTLAMSLWAVLMRLGWL
jgi:hypothetical protein